MAVIIIECHQTEKPSWTQKIDNFLYLDFLESSKTTRIFFHDFNLKGQQQDRQGRCNIKMLLET